MTSTSTSLPAHTPISLFNHWIHWRWTALKSGVLDATAYRLEFFLEVLGSAFVPAAIQWVLWYAIFELSSTQQVGGQTYSELLHYTFTSILFTQIRGGDQDFELGEMIRSGSLSNYLLKPISLIEFVYLRGLGPKLLISGFCLVGGIVVGSAFGLSPVRLVGAMFLALLGNLIHYQISAALSSVSFYWEDAYSIFMVKNMIVSLLSGELIPLHLFPESAQWIWKYTPFYLYVFGPTQYALGKWSHTELLFHLGVALGWILVGWLLVRTTWKIGIKQYSSLGG